MKHTSVRETDLPAHSALWPHVAPGDFVDCFAVAADMPPRRVAEIITRFPGWARHLLRLRRILTTPFGLSNDGPDAPDKIALFPVTHDSENEMILGFDDRHLDFRIAVLRHQGHVFLATWVHRHNIGGRLYLWAIMPFHRLIVRNGLARVQATQAAGRAA